MNMFGASVAADRHPPRDDQLPFDPGAPARREGERRSDRALPASLSALSVAAAVLDANGSVLTTNQAWRRLSSATGIALEGEDRSDGLLGSGRADAGTVSAVATAVRRVMEGAVSASAEFPVSTPGGTRWLRTRVVRYTDGDRARMLVEQTDVTDARWHGEEVARLTAAEQEARSAALAAQQVKSDFLTVMSHELRTPLSAIIGYGELLADGVTGPVTDPQRQQLLRIKASATQLLGLIEEVLTFSRMEAGEERARHERVRLDEVLEYVEAMVAPLADEKGLQLHIPEPPRQPALVTDGLKLRQILLNLVTNAVKFTERGEVTLRIDLDDTRSRFFVTDTGIGIPPEHLEQIFDPFFQAEQKKITRKAGGTGLGLSVSKQLAELLGGDITVSSTVGLGTTFELSVANHGVE